MTRRLTNRKRVRLHGMRMPICEAIAYAVIRHEEWIREPASPERLTPTFGTIQIGSRKPGREWIVWLDEYNHGIKITRRSHMWEVEYQHLHGMSFTLVTALEIALQ